MGSDIYMAEKRTPNKLDRAVWRQIDDQQVIVIQTFGWYTQEWTDKWVGPYNDQTSGLIQVMVGTVPDRPALVPTLKSEVEDILEYYIDNEYGYLDKAVKTVVDFIEAREKK